MPLPGGPANKLGNRYESWWTIRQLVRIIDKEVDSIRIEDPNFDKAEFVVAVGDSRELHQAKRSRPEGKWNLSNLRSILEVMFEKLSANENTRFVFVSGSDAPELRELAERAISAKDQEEFESIFVDAKTQKEALEKLKSIQKTDTATAYRLLHRVEVHTIDEWELEDKVRELLQARFLSRPDKVCDALRSFAEHSIHKCINRDDLISYLSGKGFSLRRLTRPSDAHSLIYEATDRYLDSTKRKLIRDSLIPRSSTEELLEKINSPAPRGSDCVVTGKAGGGKTGCVIECVEALRQSNDPIAVLAFRLDRIDPVSSTKELGKSLELEESPALVLEVAAKAISGEAVLIIDQLDAVSTTSGRSSDFFDVVEDLLDEVRGLRERVKLHVVVVCREFDWENDHRLRRLLAKDDAKISVIDFSLDEVKSSLRADGFNTALFDAKQLELLRLPQNLSLFLDANYSYDLQPDFFSEKDLFDLYWDEKREAVNRRTAFSSDNWANIIQALCDEMTEFQQLSVTKEKLDQFPNDYLTQMASEGVLSFDGKRYGFGHENFFDYCFARAFMTKEDSLVSFLIPSEQHLFRRAQVRQVLVYLRDADRGRYCRELSRLLRDERIRCHLKDLAVALAVSMPNPEEDEWNVISPWIESELEAIKSGKPNPDKFASLVWNRFYFSQNWFQIADKKDLTTSWITSDNENVIDIGVDYVRSHQEHAGDRVAELLEPFLEKKDKWSQRLNRVMQLATFENSRRLFDSFLELIDNGTLDNRTLRIGRLKVPPDWIAEATAHWLQRRLSIIRGTKDDTGKPNWSNLFDYDILGPEPIQYSASEASEEFVKHVLPVILKIADEAAYRKDTYKPKLDAVWGFFLKSEHVSIDQACKDAISTAIENLSEIRSDSIDKILTKLRSHETHMANFLLLCAYTAGAKHFANDAVSDLCADTWRFRCGYSDSNYWIAMQLIKAITPLCSDENRAKLENTIMDYTSPWENTPEGYKWRGRACFNLLSSIPVELRSRNAQGRYIELERKFGEPDSSPQELRAYTVGSPIKKTDAEKMTNEQWLRAIQEYDSEESKHRWENPEKGGALELARMLQEFVEQEPERFALLSLKFPSDTHSFYIEYTLNGLKETKGSTELKLEVCRRAYNEYRDSCGKAITDLLGSIEEPLPDDAMQMLDWLATKHSDPEKELWSEEATSGTPYYGGDILTHGINTTRGRAAWAIRDLIQRNRSYIEHFCSTIERLVNDNSVAVQACTSSTLLAILRHDSEFALGQFLKLVESRDSQPSNDHLLATPDAQRFIHYGLYEHFGDLQIVIENMLRSNLPKISQSGARLVSIALLLQHDNAEGLVEEALHGNSSQRLGVAQVASGNIGVEAYRQWSEEKLLLLFDDDDSKVRQEAAGCFRNLEEQSLESYENLIIRFCDSAAYQEDSFSLIYVLEESPYRLPGITCFVCKKFIERFSEEANDMSTNRAGDISSVSKLILRTYHQHQRDEWAAKCLDLIDQMCLEKSHAVRTDLNEYER